MLTWQALTFRWNRGNEGKVERKRLHISLFLRFDKCCSMKGSFSLFSLDTSASFILLFSCPPLCLLDVKITKGEYTKDLFFHYFSIVVFPLKLINTKQRRTISIDACYYKTTYNSTAVPYRLWHERWSIIGILSNSWIFLRQLHYLWCLAASSQYYVCIKGSQWFN